MKQAPDKFFPGSPDLAVEVLSPTERRKHVEAKIAQYFENDTKLALLVDRKRRTVQVYDSPKPGKLLEMGDSIDGGDVLPGFKFSLAELFADFDFDD